MKIKAPLIRSSRLLVAAALAGGALFAQGQAPRIHSEIASSQLTVLQGSKHPLADPQYDAGRMPADTRLHGMTLYFSRSAAQEADLNALLAAQQDPSSPQYHQWLTPATFAARFGMAQSDIDKVQNWLQQQGFSIDSVMHSRTGIRFSGNVNQVESAFQTQMHYYTVDGARHFAPSTALSVPTGLASVVLGVRNLDDFRPKPQHIVAHPNFTSGISGSVFFAPGDIVTAYDIKPLYSAGVDGGGQTIAIMGQSFVNLSDVEAFQNAAGLTKKDPQMVLVPGSGSDNTISQGDESESDLDLEWSGAIAPGANVVFVYTGSNTSFGVYDSAQYAVDNMIGNIISLSYSSCELELSATSLTQLDAVFKQAAAQGQTVMAASGDQGSTACSGDTHLTTVQQETVAVNYPASSQYVTGIGGTEAPAKDVSGGSNVATYWSSNGSSDVTSSLIQYIPESVWNDDPSSCPTGQNCLSATGGGKSTLVAQPTYQSDYFKATGEANPDSNHRLVPDIAFYSSPNAPGFLYCTSDTSALPTGVTASCGNGFRNSTTDTSLTVAGGTSFATPIFAGMVALLNENGKFVSGAGEVNTLLYKLAANSANYGANNSGAFNDITSGNNNCNTPQNCSVTTGFSATAGYDMVTGLGSINVANMALLWQNTTASASLIPTTVTVVPASTTPTVSTDDIITITVVPTTGSAPTGTVTLQIDGGTNCGGLPVTCGGTTLTSPSLDANGAVTYTANFTTAGTHQVVAQYAGDATHAASTGVAEVIISGGGSGKGTIALAASDLTVKQGSNGTTTITVTPSSGYTGTVNLSIDFGTADTALGNLCYSFTNMNPTTGQGTVAVTGTAAVTTQLNLDSNAADCASATGGVKAPGMRPFKVLMSGSTRASNQPNRHGNVPAGLAFAGLLLAGFLGRHSRKLRNLACILALAAVGFGLSACGSSSGASKGPANPPKGTYTGTIVGTDSATSTITSKTTFTFTIN